MDKCSYHLHVGGLSIITQKIVCHLQHAKWYSSFSHYPKLSEVNCFYEWKALEYTNSGRQDCILLLSTLFETHRTLMRRAAMVQPPALLPWRYSPTPAHKNYVQHFFRTLYRTFSCPKVASAIFSFTSKALHAQHQYFRSKVTTCVTVTSKSYDTFRTRGKTNLS